MYLPPIITTLATGQIGGLSTAHNDTGNSLAAALAALRSDIATQNMASAGAGRFIDTDAAAALGGTGAPRIGVGLAIELPDAVWLVGGLPVTPADLADYVSPAGSDPGYVVLDDAPPSGTFYGHLTLAYDAEERTYSLIVNWHASAGWTALQRQAERAAGRPCIGLVTTGVDDIAALDLTDADVIWSARLLQSKVTTALAAGDGGGGGGGGGGTSVTRLDQLVYNEAHPVTATTYVEGLLDAQAATLTALIQSGGRVPAPSQLGLTTHRIAQLLLMMRGIDTLQVEGVEGAYVRKGLGGDGSADTENLVVLNQMNETDRGWTP